ncbi:MAG: sigma-70 family RNA polymerase sigma factor [Planctomycetales bacterium]|nr:sigma-70 family RNA polymerase sigma factor [Planctomycetales bacterium]
MQDEALSHRERVHALFLQHSSEIRGFILSLLPNMPRTDDVFQETFLTVSRKADDYAHGTNFVAWVCRIARYKVLEDCRKHGRCAQTLAPEVIDAICASQPLLDSEHQYERLIALKSCISKLSPHTQRVVELRYAQAHQAGEIAQRLGWSVDSVYVILSRARNILEQCIRSQLQSPG